MITECNESSYYVAVPFSSTKQILISSNLDRACLLCHQARKTETSLQRIRLGAQKRAGASSDVSDHNVSETERICMQLFLDIQEYGRNLATMGVEAAKIPAYCSLWQLVAPQDRQADINF